MGLAIKYNNIYRYCITWSSAQNLSLLAFPQSFHLSTLYLTNIIYNFIIIIKLIGFFANWLNSLPVCFFYYFTVLFSMFFLHIFCLKSTVVLFFLKKGCRSKSCTFCLNFHPFSFLSFCELIENNIACAFISGTTILFLYFFLIPFIQNLIIGSLI